MKLIIDIPEEVKEVFDKAKEDDLNGSYYDYNSIIGKAIQNGTPLPKGHWIDINGDKSLWRCSHCGQHSCCYGNFCTDCGADMRES